jgi:phosphatidylserine/phosphatidylglycerophosphate/cardiolipin synthase-like enzyme
MMSMRRLAVMSLLALWLPAAAADLVLKNVPAQVYFSPHGGCQQAVVAAIATARKSILVQAYSFTSAPIAAALKEAHDRGVDVRVILDKSQRTEHYSGLTFLVHAGVPVWVDSAHAIAHNKVMVIDGETVITGSFNFTKAAEEKNSENLLVLKDANLALLYAENWESHRHHSEAQP